MRDAFARVFGDLHDMISRTPQVWLDHQLYRVPGGAARDGTASTACFHGMIDAMFGAYVALVQALCDRDWRLPIAVELPSAQRRVRDALNAVPAPGGRARCMPTSSLWPRAPAAVALRAASKR